MSTNNEPTTRDGALPGGDAVKDHGVTSIARRRALLKAAGKGAALAGAAMPLRSLATSGQRMRLTKNDGKNYVCSVSGQMSALVSGGVASVPQCVGEKVTYWCTAANWPKKAGSNAACDFGNVTRSCTETFHTCFGTGSSKTLWQVVTASPPTAETYWVCAVLNANRSSVYPYSSAEVVAQCNDAITAKQAAALDFHKILCGA